MEERGTRATIWYEDIERHRQPSLYYLSSEDDAAGPHLICDWNGPPTNFDEFDIDIMSKMIQAKPVDTGLAEGAFMFDDSLKDDSVKIPDTIVPKTNSSHTILTENDGSRLDFLTVPPLVNSLLKRLLQRSQTTENRPSPIPEESEQAEPAEKSEILVSVVKNKVGRPKKEKNT